jgi:hypothetical protein
MPMVQPIGTKLTVEEFFALPEDNGRYELIDGEAVPKVSPKHFHAGTQKALLMLGSGIWILNSLACRK